MKKADIFHMCLQNLMRRKSRTVLTLLGVVIGCCSIVIMVSIGIGMRESQQKMLSQLGDLTIITVSAQQGGTDGIKLNDSAVASFKAIPDVAAVTPKLSLDEYQVSVYAGNGDRYAASWCTIVGLDAEELEHMGYQIESGSGITKSGDVLLGRYTAYNFADSMRPEGSNMVDRWNVAYDDNGNPIDLPDPYFDALTTPMTLEIATENEKFSFPLTPVGVLKEDYVKGYETSEGIIMSLADIRSIIARVQGGAGKEINYSTVLVKTTDITKVAEVEQSIREQGYSTSSMESIRKPMEEEARQKQIMLGGLGAISLFVAALGITNTMIMSISERTREIGIMKALGCYVHDIRILFLSEAAAIGLIGGVIGCIVSFIASIVINLVALGGFQGLASIVAAIVGGEEISRVSVIPPWLLLFAVVFSIAIGIGSGYYPANKAVQISALEAIKAE